jgi:esterase/lipase
VAEAVLPLLLRLTPWLLSIYVNHRITDTSATREMVKTLDDPNRLINQQIARWIRNRDLVHHDINISEALRAVTRPLLCVVGNGDGIVPRDTASFSYHRVGSRRKTLLEVGTREISVAHADLFVSRESHERVFSPLAAWLGEQHE